MAMLTRIKLHNYRTYVNTELRLSSRHLLIGKNNSGKSNLATAIRFLGACGAADFEKALTHTPSGIHELRNWNSKDELIEFACECTLVLNDEKCDFTYELALRLVPTAGSRTAGQVELGVARERLAVHSPKLRQATLIENDGHEAKLFHEEKRPDQQPYQPKTLAPKGATMLSKLYELETNRRAILFRKFLANWTLFSLSPHAMRIGWQGRTDVQLYLEWNGANLANGLFQLKNRDEMRYRRLMNNARIIEPDLVALNFQPTPDQGIVPYVQVSDRQSASWVGLSDGTLRVLAMCYLVELSDLYPNELWPVPTLTIIEEPENGVAPSALARLYALFEECSPRGQFVFTSHSPYFIDQFDATRDCVTLVKKNGPRTELMQPPPVTPEDAGEDRLTLAEQFSSELLN